MCPAEDGAVEVDHSEVGVVEVRPFEVLGLVGVCSVRLPRSRCAAEICAVEVCKGETGIVKVCLTEVSVAEVSQAEASQGLIGQDLWC